MTMTYVEGGRLRLLAGFAVLRGPVYRVAEL